ncbi:brct domain containing protein [Paramyrothecium foliicola]|nr:brct domain containing protein [Paramyrothecium foliicola]
MGPPTNLYVIVSWVLDDDYEREGLGEPEVYTDKSAANLAARDLMYRYADQLNPLGDRSEYEYHHNLDDEGLYRGTMEGGPHGHVAVEMCVYKVRLNQPGTRKTAKRPMDGEGNWPDTDFKDKESNTGGEFVSDDEPEEELVNPKKSTTNKRTSPASNTKPATKSAPKPPAKPKVTRKRIPEGIPSCLEGVKLLFTGTFDTMDRVTSIATANKYGAEVVTKLEDTDYIVTGQRIGPKKAQVINELELETINEQEFFDILENGVSDEKRERMANKRKADEEEAPEETKRPKAAASARKKRAKR